MNMRKNNFKILASLFLLMAFSINSACTKQEKQTSQVAPQASTMSDGFEQAFKEADSLRLKAAELDYEWINTEDLLQQAKKVFADGDGDKAMQLVKEARQQAELAIQQAKTEATAWKARVVK